ncbi:MAG: hypothetical protein ACI8XC_002083, partial [Gammaproteobacteria bacterium]
MSAQAMDTQSYPYSSCFLKHYSTVQITWENEANESFVIWVTVFSFPVERL